VTVPMLKICKSCGLTKSRSDFHRRSVTPDGLQYDCKSCQKQHRDGQRQYRLSKERWHYQIVRLNHDDAETLRILAERERSTVPELIRTFVAWGLEEYDGACRA
jgi:transposase-like protein